jgi:SAM-dependent methyltransferase
MASFVQHITSSCQLKSCDHVLEIGSNNGAVLSLLAHSGFTCFGVDPSSPTVNEQLLTLQKGCFDVGFVTQYSLEKRFKCIFSRHTYEHVYDPLNFLQAASNALADDGKIFIEVPYLPMQIKRNHFEGMQLQHESFFTLTSLYYLVSNVDLVIEDFRFVTLDGGSIIVTLSRGASCELIPSYLDLEKHQGFADGCAVLAYGNQLAINASSFSGLLQRIRDAGHTIFAFGAGSKGSFICNYLNLSEYVELVLDDVQVHESTMFLPGSGLRVVNPRYNTNSPPDYVLITAPTLHAEVSRRVHALYPQARILTTTPLMGLSERNFS